LRDSFDVIIVGAGPAGSATALQLAMYGPDLARVTLLLDGESFPREKLCGGGLVPESDRFLEHLAVTCPQLGVCSVPVEQIHFEYPGGRSVVRSRRFFHVVHRRAFDAALVAAVRSRGVEVLEGEAAVRFERAADRIWIETAGGLRLGARILVGADGARSAVRRALVGSVQVDRFVALETLTPGHDDPRGKPSRTAVFDFRPAVHGIRGYAWDFPSLRGGEPWMNRGIAAGARSGDTTLRSIFEDCLAQRGIEPRGQSIEGAGAPYYEPERPQGAERVLLAGDAVGIDPWFGEGISVALGTGILAGHAAAAALQSGRFDFSSHSKTIEESAVGWSLERKRKLADVFYRVAALPGGLAPFFGGELVA
jgi:geranylgeranyl reductase family protein